MFTVVLLLTSFPFDILTGVTRQVGEALASEGSVRENKTRIVSIGIAPWGIVERRQDLIQKNGEVPYRTIHSPRSK